jgi:hypothetical protein
LSSNVCSYTGRRVSSWATRTWCTAHAHRLQLCGRRRCRCVAVLLRMKEGSMAGMRLDRIYLFSRAHKWRLLARRVKVARVLVNCTGTTTRECTGMFLPHTKSELTIARQVLYEEVDMSIDRSKGNGKLCNASHANRYSSESLTEDW